MNPLLLHFGLELLQPIEGRFVVQIRSRREAAVNAGPTGPGEAITDRQFEEATEARTFVDGALFRRLQQLVVNLNRGLHETIVSDAHKYGSCAMRAHGVNAMLQRRVRGRPEIGRASCRERV